ncbi:hypothetical protein JCM5353_005189 [Sporobolomyces roseus]
MGSSLNPWLQREWASAASQGGAKLLLEPGQSTPRAQWVKTLGETEENGERLIWAKLSDSVLEIDGCFPRECVEQFNEENALTLTACGGTKDLFKLLSWKFCLSTPPSIPPSRSTTSLKKIVCLRIGKIRLYESRIGDTNVVVARGKQIVEFRRDGKVKEQLDMVENPSVRDQQEGNVTYQDDLPSSAPKQLKPPRPAARPEEQLTFKVKPSRNSTSAPATSLSTYDWNGSWPPRQYTDSSFELSYPEIDKECEKTRKEWVESCVRHGEKSGFRVDPQLAQQEDEMKESKAAEEKDRKRKRKREESVLQPSSDAIVPTSSKPTSRRPTPINPLPSGSTTKLDKPQKSKPSPITRSSNSPSQHRSQSNSSSNPSQGKTISRKKQGVDPGRGTDRKGKGKEKQVVVEEEGGVAEEEWLSTPPDDPTPSSSLIRSVIQDAMKEFSKREPEEKDQQEVERTIRTPFAAPPPDSSVVSSDVEIEDAHSDGEVHSDADTVMGTHQAVPQEEEDDGASSGEDVANSLLSQRYKSNESSPFALRRRDGFDADEDEDADSEQDQPSSYRTAKDSKRSASASNPRKSAPPPPTARSFAPSTSRAQPRAVTDAKPRSRSSLPSQSHSSQPFTQASIPPASFMPVPAAQTKPLTPPTASLFNQTQGNSTVNSSFDLSGQEVDMPRGAQEGVMREQAERRKREVQAKKVLEREKKEMEENEKRKSTIQEWNKKREVDVIKMEKEKTEAKLRDQAKAKETERLRKEEEARAREERERQQLEAVQQQQRDVGAKKTESKAEETKKVMKRKKEESLVSAKPSRQPPISSSSSTSKGRRVDDAQEVLRNSAQPLQRTVKDGLTQDEVKLLAGAKRTRPATPISLSPSHIPPSKKRRLPPPPPSPSEEAVQAEFEARIQARKAARPRSPPGETSEEKMERLERKIKMLCELSGGADI